MLACFMSKHFAPKLCAIMVGALMVGACQNRHQSHPTNQSAIPPSAQALFTNSEYALSTQAKNELLDALKPTWQLSVLWFLHIIIKSCPLTTQTA